jgi:hypothetical protein
MRDTLHAVTGASISSGSAEPQHGVRVYEVGALMDLENIIVQLREEHKLIEECLASLQRLARSRGCLTSEIPAGVPQDARPEADIWDSRDHRD